MDQEDLWITQGYLMAVAEVVRQGGLEIGERMLADRGLGTHAIVACTMQPWDVRELLKVVSGPGVVGMPKGPSLRLVEGGVGRRDRRAAGG